eukprot:136999-Amphidinium_carterae.1
MHFQSRKSNPPCPPLTGGMRPKSKPSHFRGALPTCPHFAQPKSKPSYSRTSLRSGPLPGGMQPKSKPS